MRQHSCALLLLLALGLIFAGCEGDRGPAGPPGEPGTISPYTYVGNAGEPCQHCHGTIVATWEETGHEEAYRDLDDEDRANFYCLQCHTTGWDSEVSFGDTEIAPGNRGPDENGFDDYVGVGSSQRDQGLSVGYAHRD